MLTLRAIGATIVALILMATPVLTLAQDAQNKPAAMSNDKAALEQTQTTNPSLSVATVKLENGWRASKMIGSSVYNDENQQVGSIDDLLLSNDNKVTIAVVSVGGFLGLGSKLIAVPYDHLKIGQDRRVTLPGASQETLNSLPSFTYHG
jgi:sporulation protein YlmC with PRC-barrel domain